MPAAMKSWGFSGDSSKEGQDLVRMAGNREEIGGQRSELVAGPMMASGSKRQRRPSVRLGEIGDLKVAAPKTEALSTVRWISPNFLSRKTPSRGGRGVGKFRRTRPLANVAHRREVGQAVGCSAMGTNDVVIVPAAAAGITGGCTVVKTGGGEQVGEAACRPCSSGHGSYATGTDTGVAFGIRRRGKPGKRKRASNVRSSTIARTIGAVAVSREGKEAQKVGYVADLIPTPAVSNLYVSRIPTEVAELSGTQKDIEGDSGAARGDPGDYQINVVRSNQKNEDQHAQNGDTEVLEDDYGNGEDSSGRLEEEDFGASPGVGVHQITERNGSPNAPHDFPSTKIDHRQQSTNRLTGGDQGRKDRKGVLLVRENSLNGKRDQGGGGVRGWLTSLGLEKYCDLFEENEVDNDVVRLLTFEDLKEMGVGAVGARRKMFSAIQELKSSFFPGTLASD